MPFPRKLSPLPGFLLFFSLVLGLASPVCLWAEESDIEIVAYRLRDDAMGSSTPSNSTISGYQNSLTSGGSYGGKMWSDLNYASTVQTGWTLGTHLDRMIVMARAYNWSTSSYYKNEDLKNDILAAFDFWVARKPSSTNWWYADISIPPKMGQIMLLMNDQFSTTQKNSGLSIIYKSYRSRNSIANNNTGANRVDLSTGMIYWAVLKPSESQLSESFLAIGDTIVLTTNEGIQPDYSYQQHGAQLYIQGYGSVYTSGLLNNAAWGAGTSFGYSEEQIQILTDYFLNGVQWFLRGKTTDFTATGRGLARSGSWSSATQYVGQLGQLLAINSNYRTAEIQSFLTRVSEDSANGSATPELEFCGNKMFWKSDIMTHRRPDFYISAHLTSKRTSYPETGNGESLKCLLLGDGTTPIIRTGNEYNDIMPAWDWYRLPGITAEQGTYSLKPGSEWERRGNVTHVGGVSDGTFGAAVFDLSRAISATGTTTAKKSWFFFDDGMVALGAEISGSSATTGNINTTLNQALRNGTVTYKAAGSQTDISTNGELVVPSVEWVHHDGISYVFPNAGTSAVIKTATQTGSWNAINSSQSSTTVSKNVFTLWLNHGLKPSAADYAYIVLPGLTTSEIDAWRNENPVEILRNDSVAQAVRRANAGVTMVNFWTDASTTVGSITSDKKASVLMRNTGEFLDVYIADPTQLNSGEINLLIDVPVTGVVASDENIVAMRLSGGKAKIVFSASGTTGRTYNARFRLTGEPDPSYEEQYETITLAAVADAYVWDRNPTTNYGASTSLPVKTTGGSTYEREAYFRFDVSAITGTPISAQFSVAPSGTKNPPKNSLVACSNGWEENTVTWNTKPTRGSTTYGTWTVAPLVSGSTEEGYPVFVNVLPAVLGAQASTSTPKTFSLGIYPTIGSDDSVAYYSRETADPDKRPALKLVFERNPDIEPVSAVSAIATATTTTPGKFIFTRSGNIAGDIMVGFTVSGDAIAGTDYTALPNSITIPTGQSTVELQLNPIFNTPAPRKKTVTISLNDGSGSATANLAFLGPIDAWRLQRLGTYENTGFAADTADPDGDGLDNLLEYALNGNPLKNDAGLLPSVTRSGNDLVFTYRQNIAATDITFTVEQSSDLKNWTPVTATPQMVSSEGTSDLMEVRVPMPEEKALFLRLRVSR